MVTNFGQEVEIIPFLHMHKEKWMAIMTVSAFLIVKIFSFCKWSKVHKIAEIVQIAHVA